MRCEKMKDVCVLGFLALLGLLWNVLFYIVTMPLYVTLFIASKTAYILAKIKYGKSVGPVSGLDVIYGAKTKGSDAYFNAVASFKGRVDVEQMKSRLLTMIRKCDANGDYPCRRFGQILTKYCGYHLFKDAESFDISNHVKLVHTQDLHEKNTKQICIDHNMEHSSSKIVYDYSAESFPLKPNENGGIAVAKEGNDQEEKPDSDKVDCWESMIEKLMWKCSKHHPPKNQPQWEFIILHDDKRNRSSAIFRAHHSITDGVMLMKNMIDHLVDPTDIKEKSLQPYESHKPSIAKRILYSFWSLCLVPPKIVKLLKFDKNPLHGPKLTGTKIHLISKTLPLSWIKVIKKKTGATSTAILLSCISKAFALNMQRKKSDTPSITLLIPTVIKDPRKTSFLGNNSGFKFITLPVCLTAKQWKASVNNRDLFLPSISRLKIVNKFYINDLDTHSFMVLQWTVIGIGSILPARLLTALISLLGVTSMVSNMAGPPEEYKITGCPKTAMSFWPPDCDPVGVAISFYGYKGDLRIGFSMDTGLMEHPDEGSTFLEDAVAEVHNLHKEVTSLDDNLNEIEGIVV